MKELFIIKIGGNSIDNPGILSKFLNSFCSVKGNKILVHGGGNRANDLSLKLGIVPEMVDGRRITSVETLHVVAMAYSAINKEIAAMLNSKGLYALGVCGADFNLLPAKKRRKGIIDYGLAGDILFEKIPVSNWQLFLENNICPVVSPITADDSGQLLNTNADTIASSIAMALSKIYKVKLIYCFDKNGLLKDINDEQSVIPEIKIKDYARLKELGVISKGMLPKIDNAIEALNYGVSSVTIGNADDIEELILPGNKNGTTLLN